MAYVDVDTDVKHYTDPLEEKIDELEIDTGHLEKRIDELEDKIFAIQQRDNFVNMMKIKREKDNA